jgi:hypothetical protein
MLPIKLDRENNARNRCLSADEQATLMKALPDWLRPMVTVALNTGMCLGELRALRWGGRGRKDEQHPRQARQDRGWSVGGDEQRRSGSASGDQA